MTNKRAAELLSENLTAIYGYAFSKFRRAICKTRKPFGALLCDAILCKDANRDNPTLPWLIEHKFILCEDNKLSANFLVFDSDVFEQVAYILSDIIEEAANCMIDISNKAEKILVKHAPASLKEQCGDIAKIHHRLDVAAFLLEELIKENKLIVPNERTPLCVWGVKK